MIFLMVAIAAFASAALGAYLMSHYLETATPAAKMRTNHRDAVALARDLIKTPDALELRDRANQIVSRYEALTSQPFEEEY